MKRWMWIPMLAVLGSGCVPMAKYEALQSQLDKCQANKKGDRNDEWVQKRMAAHKALVQELKPLVDKGLLTVEVIDGLSVVSMRSEVLFPSGSAELSASGVDTLHQISSVLARRTDEDYQIQGHTDTEAIHTDKFPDNWWLGAARAINVVEEMTKAGMPPTRLSAASYGQYAPVESNATEEGKAQNRRIELVLVPDASLQPGYDALMREGKGGRKVRRNNNN